MIAASRHTTIARRVADREERRLLIDEAAIRRNGPGNLAAVCWRQWRTERALARRGIRFRTTRLPDVEAAYASMSEPEFEAVNGRQDWANWRTIARSMSGLVPDRPLTAVDLGCGSGGSTRVLAYYAPLGSRIIGYELAQPLVNIARSRTFLHCSGRPVRVSICCQGITEPLRDCFDRRLSSGSVDLVNASGVIGHHLSAEGTTQLLDELRRILVRGGLAMLDVGPGLSADELTAIAVQFGFEPLRFRRSSPVDRTGQVTFRRGGALLPSVLLGRRELPVDG